MDNDIKRGSGNISIDNFIIGNEAWAWKHKFVKNDAVPACDLENKVIMSPMFGAILDENDDTIVRGKNEHEAGHARLTPHNKLPHWSPLKGNIINALEDLRIEEAIGRLSGAIKSDIAYLNRSLLSDINRKFANGEVKLKPVDEALLAMHMMENGVSPMWVLSPKAQAYFDAAYPIYQTWKDINNLDNKMGFAEIEVIADKVIEAFKESLKNQEPENQKNGKNGNNGKSGDKGNENNEQNQSHGDNQSGDEGDNSGEDNTDENSESDEKNSNSGDNADKENKGGSASSDPEDEGKEDKGEKNGKNKSANNDEQGNNNDNGVNDSGDAGDEMDNADSKSSSDGNDNGENRNSAKPSNEVGSEDDDKASAPGFGGNKNNKRSKAKKTNRDIEKELNEDFSNDNVEEKAMSEKLKRIYDKSQEVTHGYTAYTGNDTVIPAEANKDGFNQARQEISTQIAMLSSYTEDALKAMSRVAYQRNLERGKIDHRKLVGLSKSLTKKVFYKAKDGIDLNVAVTVMIDESGSIGYMCYQLRSLAIAFSEVFTRLGIKFEVLGFTTEHGYFRGVEVPSGITRTTPMVIYEHKTFDEPYQIAKYKLGSIDSYNCNIDGESLLLAFKRIKVQRTSRHVIFVLSDGMPNQGYNSASLYRHLSDSVKFVRNNGVEVYGFGIGTDEPEKFYGKDNFVYLEDIKKLGPQFFRRFREIVAKR